MNPLFVRSGGGLLCGAAHRARPKPFGAAVRCGGGLLFGASHGARPKPFGAVLRSRPNCREAENGMDV